MPSPIRFTPPPEPPRRSSPDDPRVGDFLPTRLDPSEARVVLAGFPCDSGVVRNGGRPGAAAGPAALRRTLHRLTPDAEHAGSFIDLLRRTDDLGDLALTGDLAGDQQRLGDALAPHLERGAFVIVLGGGHETSFGHFLAHAGAARATRILSWDAHTDVRPLIDGQPHSGSPFRQAIGHESRACRGYTIAGALPHAVAPAHRDWIVERGGDIVWRHELTTGRIAALYRDTGPMMVSFDLDAVEGMAGVSAPAVGGMSPDDWLLAAFEAGRSPDVASADVVELNPAVDRDGRTVALAAATVWWILKGIAAR